MTTTEQETIKPGMYPAMKNEDYHRSTGISKSGLDLIHDRNPWLYAHRYIDQEKQEPTKAMVIGSATHTLVFEPELFDSQYVVDPGFNRRSKQGKLDAEQFELEHQGKQVLTREEHAQIDAIATAVVNHPVAAKILANGAAENSYYAIDPETQLLVKVRPDWETGNVLVDLKTCQVASPQEFSKVIFNRRYYVQAAMYKEVVNLVKQAKEEPQIDQFVFIAVEKTPPYMVAIYYATDEMMFHGLEQYKQVLRQYAKCLQEDRWPGYNNDEIAPIYLPKWAENQLNRGLMYGN